MTENPYFAGPPRGFHPPDPRDLIDPEIQAETNRRGALLAREALATIRLDRDQTIDLGPPCGHPGQPSGRTPAGDAWCGECRRDESGTGLREAVAEGIPHDDEPPEEDW